MLQKLVLVAANSIKKIEVWKRTVDYFLDETYRREMSHLYQHPEEEKVK
jgi:hypothetical protein